MEKIFLDLPTMEIEKTVKLNSSEVKKLTVNEEMDELLNGLNNNKEEEEILSQFDIKATIKEFCIYDSSGKCTEKLEKLNQCLETIQSATPNPERSFSTTNHSITKLHSNMTMKTIDDLTILKEYPSKIKRTIGDSLEDFGPRRINFGA